MSRLTDDNFNTRYLAATIGVLAGGSFNLLLAYASEDDDCAPRWYVAVGGDGGCLFTAKEARKFGRKLVQHAERKVREGIDDAREWSKHLHEVADECDSRNEHGVLPEHIQRPQ